VFSLGKKSIENLIGVDDELIDVVELAIEITKVDFGIPSTGGYRVEAEQAKLFTAGLSKADGRVNKSKHQTGRAVDVFAYVDGKASYNTEHLAMVAAAMLQAASQLNIELKWGGHFRSFTDMPHFELGG
jgi:peptidoglycan L-alanyl-D-glutamate endopeptidase CwlK